MENKKIFNVFKIDTQKLANAHGLANVPELNLVETEGPILSKEDRQKARVKMLR